ncbi:MAG: RNA 2'-phosphotransferase [Deltaproteobacteria bacterium]|nr:RNA 2'-phosphotransferase [Deltaproteobacteria bacterium]
MVQRKSPKQLSKFISYVLGRKPGEFGLVPDDNGYIKIKEFLKAICEEDGFRYVRRSHIDEILISLTNPPIEIHNNHIRAKFRDGLPNQKQTQNLPKLLYTCARRKAYPEVLVKGIFPMDFKKVILSSTPDMAERIGKRKDQFPVLLTVQTQKSIQQGIIFYEAGETLFIAESIHTGCFTGPPLPKQKTPVIKPETQVEQALSSFPGSFIVEKHNIDDRRKAYQQKRKRKTVAWKKEQKGKKHKSDRERPPWRRDH